MRFRNTPSFGKKKKNETNETKTPRRGKEERVFLSFWVETVLFLVSSFETYSFVSRRYYAITTIY